MNESPTTPSTDSDGEEEMFRVTAKMPAIAVALTNMEQAIAFTGVLSQLVKSQQRMNSKLGLLAGLIVFNSISVVIGIIAARLL